MQADMIRQWPLFRQKGVTMKSGEKEDNAMHVMLIKILTISPSSADCEWEFSGTNLDKTYLRTRLNNDA